MPVGSQLNITLPTVGQAAWGGSLNTVLQTLVDAIEESVPVSAFDVGANLDMQGYQVVNAAGLGFSSGDPGTANTIFMLSGELYIRDGNNTRVQVSSSGTINVSVNGGFGGDYAGNGLAVYSSSGNSYTFTSAAGTYSVMENGQVKIHNGASVGYTSLRPPSGQSSNIDLTLPSSLPGAGIGTVICDQTGTMNVQLSASFTQLIAPDAWRIRTTPANWGAGTLPWFQGAIITFPIGSEAIPLVFPLALNVDDAFTGFRLNFDRVEANRQGDPNTVTVKLKYKAFTSFGSTDVTVITATSSTGSNQQVLGMAMTGSGYQLHPEKAYWLEFQAATSGTVIRSGEFTGRRALVSR